MMVNQVELPTGWARIVLEDVADICDNLREPVNSAERAKRHGPYPYYGATGQVGWIDDYRQDGEYILLGEDGAPFFDWSKDKAYLVSGKCWVNNHAHVLKGKERICENKYLLYALNQTDYRGYANGTTRLKLTQSAMRQIPINLAPHNEQRRIVAKIEELFSELDKGIENLKTAQAQLKVYRQALLKHAFEGNLTAQWRAENQDKLETAEALLKRIQQARTQRYQQQLTDWETSGRQGSKPKAPKSLPLLTAEELTELQKLPKGWTWVKYGELIESSQNGISKRSGSTGQEVIVLRLADIFEQKISVNNSRKIMLTEKELDNYRLSKNDLLCIRVNGSPDLVGRMVTIEEDTNIAYCDHFIRYRLLANILNSKYLASYFNTVPIRRYIDLNKVSSAGQNTVNQEMIGSITVAFCCKAEQEAIVDLLEERLSEADYLNETITTSLQQAEALRQSILKKAFSGQLVPQDPNDEPASVLLARIKAEKMDNVSIKTKQQRARKASA